MKSIERFNKICSYQMPDRFPVDYLAHPETDRNLKKFFGVNTEKELLDILGSDFYYLSCRDISQNEGYMKYHKAGKKDLSETERTCSLGIRWHRQAYESKFWVDEAIRGPLENAATAADIIRHEWPKAADFDFSDLAAEAEEHSERVIVGGLWSGIMGDSYRMHGFQNFLMNIAVEPELIKTLIDRTTEMYLELNDKYFSQLKNRMQVWFFGNDFGSQNGLLFSPDMWYGFFFENIEKLTSLAHSYGLKVMMHSCGAVKQIIPWLIKAGVDILDPIQVTAWGMAPLELSREFGGKIIFHGGVDTQNVLPSAKPHEVENHAMDTIKGLGAHGGYIFAPSQILGPDIPVENIEAMYKVGTGLNKLTANCNSKENSDITKGV